jgi:hypothetical protein
MAQARVKWSDTPDAFGRVRRMGEPRTGNQHSRDPMIGPCAVP